MRIDLGQPNGSYVLRPAKPPPRRSQGSGHPGQSSEVSNEVCDYQFESVEEMFVDLCEQNVVVTIVDADFDQNRAWHFEGLAERESPTSNNLFSGSSVADYSAPRRPNTAGHVGIPWSWRRPY